MSKVSNFLNKGGLDKILNIANLSKEIYQNANDNNINYDDGDGDDYDDFAFSELFERCADLGYLYHHFSRNIYPIVLEDAFEINNYEEALDIIDKCLNDIDIIMGKNKK